MEGLLLIMVVLWLTSPVLVVEPINRNRKSLVLLAQHVQAKSRSRAEEAEQDCTLNVASQLLQNAVESPRINMFA